MRRIKQTFAIAALGLSLAAALARPAGAQVQFNRPTQTGAPTAPPPVLEKVGIDQKLGERVPADLVFKDESGKDVTLGEYFNRGGKPVVIAPVYYECPMLCTMTLNGITRSLKPLKLTPGKDFELITFSFDPSEGHELAAEKKANYLEQYGRPEAAAGWHFLTGPEASVKALTDAIGFRYTYDENTQQYAHASAIMLLTPDGTLSRYFYGLEYSSRDLRLGLLEASDGKVGTLADELLLLCFHYDPSQGKYGPAVMRMIRVGGVVTLLGVGGFVGLMLLRERRATAAAATSAADASATPSRTVE